MTLHRRQRRCRCLFTSGVLPRPGADVMKQRLLRVAGVDAKVGVNEMTQLRGGGSAVRKVELTQRLHHPDIHRERLVESVGKEENAVGDLQADAGKSREPAPGFL